MGSKASTIWQWVDDSRVRIPMTKLGPSRTTTSADQEGKVIKKTERSTYRAAGLDLAQPVPADDRCLLAGTVNPRYYYTMCTVCAIYKRGHIWSYVFFCKRVIVVRIVSSMRVPIVWESQLLWLRIRFIIIIIPNFAQRSFSVCEIYADSVLFWREFCLREFQIVGKKRIDRFDAILKTEKKRFF